MGQHLGFFFDAAMQVDDQNQTSKRRLGFQFLTK